MFVIYYLNVCIIVSQRNTFANEDMKNQNEMCQNKKKPEINITSYVNDDIVGCRESLVNKVLNL